MTSITGKFCQTIKEKMIPILSISSRKIGPEVALPNSFYKSSITLHQSQINILQERKI